MAAPQWSEARLFNRLVVLGQSQLVAALRRIADAEARDLVVASERFLSDDEEVAAQVRLYVERVGGRVVVSHDTPRSPLSGA